MYFAINQNERKNLIKKSKNGVIIKYCPTCNRNSNEFKFIGDFCEICSTKKILETIPDSIEINQCKDCKKIKTNLGYYEFNKASLVALLSKIVKNSSVKILNFDQDKKTILARFTIHKDQDKLVFEKQFSYKIKNLMCQQCYWRHSGYYEAIVQLRIDSDNMQQNKQDKIERILKSLTNFIINNNGFIARIDKEKFGYDIYTSNKIETARYFAIKKYKPKVSFTLYGLKNGKRVYRNTYLLKI